MRIILIALMLLCGLAMPSLANDEIVKGIAKPWQSYYQGAATPVMDRVQGLHNYIFIIITVITIFVTLLLSYVCIRFYHKRNPKASKTTHNTMLEVAWITIPALILATIFVPSLKLHYYMDKTHNPDLTLKITGYQWYWGFSYPDQEVEEYLSNMKTDKERKAGEPRLLAADNPLVVPVGANIRVLLTGSDVIHSFAMPAFGVKTDCIPGRLNETWFQANKTGIYYGQCSELCGQKHGFMPIEVRVVEKDVFKQWVERAKQGNFALDGINIPTDNKVAIR